MGEAIATLDGEVNWRLSVGKPLRAAQRASYSASHVFDRSGARDPHG